MKIKILKEVEGFIVSKLDADKQKGTDAPCLAVKQFLHEAPYEQVRGISKAFGWHGGLCNAFQQDPMRCKAILTSQSDVLNNDSS